jgi:hypothetical protein
MSGKRARLLGGPIVQRARGKAEADRVDHYGFSLTFTQQPANTAAGALMAAVMVKVTDNGGNPVSGVTISLTAQGGPGRYTEVVSPESVVIAIRTSCGHMSKRTPL